MSLAEALTWDDTYVDSIRRADPDLTLEPLEATYDAARRWDGFPGKLRLEDLLAAGAAFLDPEDKDT